MSFVLLLHTKCARRIALGAGDTQTPAIINPRKGGDTKERFD
jgi:hypothetical protein